MKPIKIKDIRPEGSVIEDFISADILHDLEEEGFKFTKPVKITAVLEHVSNEVLAHIKVDAEFISFCYRCLKGLDKHWNTEFDLEFQIDRNKEFLDIEDDIRQEIMIGLPDVILCKEDCKGLCPNCGKDLNEGPCKCKKE